MSRRKLEPTSAIYVNAIVVTLDPSRGYDQTAQYGSRKCSSLAAQRALIRGPYYTPKWPGSFIVSIQTQSAKLYHLRTIKGKTHLAYIRGGGLIEESCGDTTTYTVDIS